MSTNEQEKFEAWWKEKGFNSVILRAAALTAWMARAEMDEQQPQPAEDPDEWVTQDRVPMRDVVDQGRYQLKETRPLHDAIWYALSDMNIKTRGLMHGATHPYDPNCMLFVRCRRRDLPSVYSTAICSPYPQPTKTRVRLFRSLIDGLVVAESECPDSDWQEIHHDSEGFYVEGGQS